jgi:hypothetical protein
MFSPSKEMISRFTQPSARPFTDKKLTAKLTRPLAQKQRQVVSESIQFIQ